MKRTILAALNTIPELVDGKVCVLNDNGKGHKLYTVGRYTRIQQKFDPLFYVLIEREGWQPYVVSSKYRERISHIENDKVKRLRQKYYPETFLHEGQKFYATPYQNRVDDKVYTILKCAARNEVVLVTCDEWKGDTRWMYTNRIQSLI